jgi:hypothetical protein
MGFPLSTDIFGQLRWLVKQVKILIFRVTRIEQNGGSAQTIEQVLTTGDSAANKFLKLNDTTTFIETTYSANGFSITNSNPLYNDVTFDLIADYSSGFPVLKTTFNDLDSGFHFYNNKAFVIGKHNTSHIGIDTNTNKLLGAGIYQSGDHNNPAGFVEINIDGTPYWIELWNNA